MAATTSRKRIGIAVTGSVAFDAAPGDVWTLLATGALGLIIKPEKGVPPFEIWHGATGLPAVTAQGILVDWGVGDNPIFQMALLTGNSVYYRASSPTQFTYSTDA